MTEQQFNKIYWENIPHLFSYAGRILKNKQDAEDICTEVFCKFWAQRDRLTGIKSVKAHLLTCTKNAALNLVNKSKRSRCEEEIYGEQLETIDYGPEDDLKAERMKLIIKAIYDLPERKYEDRAIERMTLSAP